MKRTVRIMLSAMLLVGLLVSNVSCSSMNAANYSSYYRSSEYQLRDTVVAAQVQFILTGVTKEVDCARMLLDSSGTKDEIRSYYNSPEAGMSYELKIVLPSSGVDIYNYNPKSQIQPSQRSAYFSFDIKRDLMLITEANDTLPCVVLLHERGMSNSPIARFSMSFSPCKKGDRPKKIVLHDRALTAEILDFNIERYADLRLPRLRFK